jgi:hypothetical protein
MEGKSWVFQDLLHLELKDKTISFSAWVYSKQADKVRLNLLIGNDSTFSDYHPGDGWVKLYITDVPPLVFS